MIGERRNHFRHCSKHGKPLPCAYCVLTTEPGQVAVLNAEEARTVFENLFAAPAPRVVSRDEKQMAAHFLVVLKNIGLSIQELPNLSVKQQSKLRKGFLVEFGYEPTSAEVAKVIEQLEPAAQVPSPDPVAQAQQTVNSLLEAVDAAETDKEVKQALRETFSEPPQQKPRKRGRPPKWVNDAVRKREERREKKVADAIKQQGTDDATGGRGLGTLIEDAPQGCGRIETGEFGSSEVDTIRGMREGEEYTLSRLPDNPEDILYPKSSLSPAATSGGDRRRVGPVGCRPTEFETEEGWVAPGGYASEEDEIENEPSDEDAYGE